MSSPTRSEPLPVHTKLAVGATLLAGAALLAGLWNGARVNREADRMRSEASLDAPTVMTEPVADPVKAPLDRDELWSADIAKPEDRLITRDAVLRSRDTLAELLDRMGVTPQDSYSALQAVFERDLLDARRVRPGLDVTATLRQGPGETARPRLLGLSLRNASDHSLLVTRTHAGSFEAARLDARLSEEPRRIKATVDTTLYEAALDEGARDQQVVDFARIFAYDIDFQREIHPGDQFEIVYETLIDETGRDVRSGNVLFAAIDGKALTRAFYRFTPSDDAITDYFDRNGESATKFLMKTPINGARLSSHFGRRRHPIAGYTRMHEGTDFAAPRGTPVYAAGHGRVERASRYGGYGNYIRLRHANGYQTAYAHLSGYANGVRKGARVRQGEVIGYVGTTGASTGPHLHYEVLIHGKPRNPMTLDLPTGRKLDGEIFDAFQARRAEIDKLRAGESTPRQVASAMAGSGGGR